MHAEYVFAYPRGAERKIRVDPAALGFSRGVYVFDFLARTGHVVTTGPIEEELSGDYGYFVVVPLGKSGIAFIGDAGQFVTLGKQRIPEVSDDGSVEVSIAFARGEGPRTLIGYSPTLPKVKASDGSAAPPSYNSGTHLFRVEVSAGADAMALVRISR
jgi:hypothetical protein